MAELEEPTQPEQKSRSLLMTRVTPGLFLLVVAGIAIFRLWVVETAYVEGLSMADTLRQGDRVLVLKFLDIDRFDIVVLRDPDEDGISIKRVVGLPGDVVSMVPRIVLVDGQEMPVGSQLYLNSQRVDEPYANSLIPSSVPPVQVPKGRYFVLGDNRDDSVDSRRYGLVKADRIVGVGVAVAYPFGHAGLLGPPGISVGAGETGPTH
jgi:signal peptidase I